MDGKATDGHSKPVSERSHARSMAPRLMMLLAVIQAFCGTVFLIDWLTEKLRHRLLSLEGEAR